MKTTKLTTIALAAALAACGQNASADPDSAIKLTVGRTFKGSGSYMNTTFTLTNGPRAYQMIVVECALLDASNRPITVDRQPVFNVAAGATVYGEVSYLGSEGVSSVSASCRVSILTP
jgi:hypothetical protein